ncbi:MAG: CDP-alcohol phosphatidyltransferase family protein [Trueperaceae bacterium]|nr:CDP-alcohol phosphatidyltransferase family protein [Trueperaceae bacterium]
MIDRGLRPLKSYALGPATSALAPRLARWGAMPVTALGLGVGLAAAVAGAAGAFGPALWLWWGNRLLDGLDGEVARRLGRADDRGGYVDLIADLVVYALVPIGAAVGATAPWSLHGATPDPWTWPAAAALLGAYYVNLGSHAYLAALLEKRGRGAAMRPDVTSFAMPGGLVEGFETIVLVSLMLAVPALLPWWFGLAAVLVAVTAGQRVWWTVRTLAREAM